MIQRPKQRLLFRCSCGEGRMPLMDMCMECYKELGRDLGSYARYIEEVQDGVDSPEEAKV